MLIFDEPTGNLDIGNEALILKEIQQIAHKGKITVLVSIHDLQSAIKYGDAFLFLKNGKVINMCLRKDIREDIFSQTFDLRIKIKEYDGEKIILKE